MDLIQGTVLDLDKIGVEAKLRVEGRSNSSTNKERH